MPSFNIASDLSEFTFAPEEQETARCLKDPQLALMLLQNTRVGVVRQLASFTFDGETNDKDIRSHAYLRGKFDMLSEIISAAIEQAPIPVPADQADPSNS